MARRSRGVCYAPAMIVRLGLLFALVLLVGCGGRTSDFFPGSGTGGSADAGAGGASTGGTGMGSGGSGGAGTGGNGTGGNGTGGNGTGGVGTGGTSTGGSGGTGTGGTGGVGGGCVDLGSMCGTDLGLPCCSGLCSPNGACVSCQDFGGGCGGDEQCCGNLVCVDGACDEFPFCGRDRQPCSRDLPCCLDFSCVRNFCQCGDPGSVCSPEMPCCGGLACVGGRCSMGQMCVGNGQPCNSDGICCSGICAGGFCGDPQPPPPPIVCPSGPTDCSNCMAQNCCFELDFCLQNPACSAGYDCFMACGASGAGCLNMCLGAPFTPGGAQLVACARAQCPACL